MRKMCYVVKWRDIRQSLLFREIWKLSGRREAQFWLILPIKLGQDSLREVLLLRRGTAPSNHLRFRVDDICGRWGQRLAPQDTRSYKSPRHLYSKRFSWRNIVDLHWLSASLQASRAIIGWVDFRQSTLWALISTGRSHRELE